jgi:hypothetical protein
MFAFLVVIDRLGLTTGAEGIHMNSVVRIIQCNLPGQVTDSSLGCTV